VDRFVRGLFFSLPGKMAGDPDNSDPRRRGMDGGKSPSGSTDGRLVKMLVVPS
jgi:hypothetical protein